MYEIPGQANHHGQAAKQQEVIKVCPRKAGKCKQEKCREAPHLPNRVKPIADMGAWQIPSSPSSGALNKLVDLRTSTNPGKNQKAGYRYVSSLCC